MLMRFAVKRVPVDVRPAWGLVCVALAGALLVSWCGSLAPAWGSSSCPNELFRTGPGANLPDCRAYELVSPPNKNGGEVDGGPVIETLPAPMQASLNGEAVTYGSQTPFPEVDPLSGMLTMQYLSRRGPDGWYTEALDPEQDLPGNVFDKNQGSEDFSLFQGFSENLEYSFLQANNPAPAAGAPFDYYNPYLRDDFTGSYSLLSTVIPPDTKPGATDISNGLRTEYAGMSPDGRHVAFSASDALTPGSIQGETNLYEWSEGKLELISVLPDGEAVSGERVSPDINFGDPSYYGLSGGGLLAEGFNRAISVDGSRVIWSKTVGENAGTYVSELVASGNRIIHGPLAGRYETASVDDGKVVMNDEGQLMMYEPAEERSTDLTSRGADVIEVLGASEGASYVYFDADGVLAAGASEGKVNVYVWHDGAIGFIGGISKNDYALAEASGQFPGPLNQGNELISYGTSRVSPDGRYLAFEATTPLTGYENRPLQSGACESVEPFWRPPSLYANPSGRCVEVYEYDAQAGRLRCASCNPRGLPPVGNSIAPMELHAHLQAPGWQSRTVQQRYLLDDGRLFFDSTDALLPQASNLGKLNVYEYEPDEIGSCHTEAGCLSLISTGTSSDDSYFLDAGASGNDVFFITRQQLVAQDGDEALDVYDARADGGFSAAVSSPCGGEACRAAVTSPPAIYEAPPSATFVGPGNPPPPTTQSRPAKAKKKPKPKPKHRRRAKARSHKRSTSRSREHRSARSGGHR